MMLWIALSNETSHFIQLHRKDDVRMLALQAGKHPEVDMAEAVVQIAGWQVGREESSVLGTDRRDSLSEASLDGTVLFGGDGTL